MDLLDVGHVVEPKVVADSGGLHLARLMKALLIMDTVWVMDDMYVFLMCVRLMCCVIRGRRWGHCCGGVYIHHAGASGDISGCGTGGGAGGSGGKRVRFRFIQN